MNWDWLLRFAAIFAVLLILVLSRRGRMSIVWGATWGVAAGLWIIAPWLLRTHHLVPGSASEWVALLGYLIAAFGLLGGAIALAGLPIVMSGSWIVRRRFLAGETGWCAATALTLPLFYIALSVALERVIFNRMPAPGAYGWLVGSWLIAYAAAFAVFLPVCRRAVRDGRSGVRTLCVIAAAAIALGVLALPYRVGLAQAPAAVSRDTPLVPKPGKPASAPLLIVGLDGGNWRPIRPLLGGGTLPTLDRLISAGLQGEVEALWPPYWSAPAWGALVTGFSRDEIGVSEDLSGKAPGLPLFDLPLEVNLAINPIFGLEYLLISSDAIETMPPPRSMLKRTPYWELLSSAGVKTAVFRLHFTHPAAGQADFVVSNRVGPDLFSMLNVRQPKTGLVSPQERAAALMTGFASDYPVSRSLIDEFNPKREKIIPADMTLDPTQILMTAEEIDDRTLASATNFIKDSPDVQVVAVHIVGFDNVSHALSQYRFPEDYPNEPPAASDVQRFGKVVDRYLEFLDVRIGKLIAAFPEPPNVIVISDHGHGPSAIATFWRDFHESPGLFISAGPDIPVSQNLIKVSSLRSRADHPRPEGVHEAHQPPRLVCRRPISRPRVTTLRRAFIWAGVGGSRDALPSLLARRVQVASDAVARQGFALPEQQRPREHKSNRIEARLMLTPRERPETTSDGDRTEQTQPVQLEIANQGRHQESPIVD